jgi:hypothetical protein
MSERRPVPYTIHFGHSIRAEAGLCGTQATMVSILPRLVTCQQCVALMSPHDRKEVSRTTEEDTDHA